MEFKVPAPRIKSAAAKPSTPSATQAPPPLLSPPTPSLSSPPSSSRAPPPPPYTPPLWSSPALHPYSFSILRHGSLLSTHPLTSHPYLLIGRLPSCPLSLSHPSISRYHAVLQHHQDGRVFLYDLNSSHGTFINKQRVTPHTFIELRVGDMVRFGDSERIYLLEGPDELRPVEKELTRKRGQVKPHPSTQHEVKEVKEGKEEKEEEEFLTWGMADEPVADEVDPSSLFHRVSLYLTGESPSLSSSDESSLTSSQRGIVQRVEKKKLKLMNVQQELDVLIGKESQGELSEGQRAQKDKNEKRVTDMQDEVMNDITELQQLMDAGDSHPTSKQRHDSDDDDDDYLDRTSVKPSPPPSTISPLSSLLPLSSLVSVSSVAEQLRRCEELRDGLRVVLSDLTRGEEGEEEDSLEEFMRGVEEERRRERRERVKGELRALQVHYEGLKGRLREKEAGVRVEKLKERMREEEHVNVKEEQKEEGREDEQEAESNVAQKVEVKATEGGTAAVLARMRKKQESVVAASLTHSTTSALPGPSPSPAPQPPPPPPSANPSSSSSSISDLVRRLDAARATKPHPDSSLTSQLKRRLDDNSTGGLFPAKRLTTPIRDTTDSHTPHDEYDDTTWRPPTNQTGDGRTSLNARLGY